jgi:CBS domain-containing protein
VADTIKHAAVLMIHGGYRHLPMVDDKGDAGWGEQMVAYG